MTKSLFVDDVENDDDYITITTPMRINIIHVYSVDDNGVTNEILLLMLMIVKMQLLLLLIMLMMTMIAKITEKNIVNNRTNRHEFHA